MSKSKAQHSAKFTKDGRFLAHVSSKLGSRNEISVHPVNNDHTSFSNALIKRFELDDAVRLYEWIYVNKDTNGNAKKRGADGHDAGSDNASEECYLYVVLNSGTVYVLSPFKDEELYQSTEITKLVDLSPSSYTSKGEFWASGSTSGHLGEITGDAKVVSSVRYPKGLKVNVAELVKINSKEVLALGGRGRVVLMDPTKEEVIAELTDEEFSQKHELIGDLLQVNDYLLASVKSLNKLGIYDLKRKALVKVVKPTTIISKLFTINDESVGVISSNGEIEVLHNLFEFDQELRSSVIKTSDHRVKLNDAVTVKDTLLVSYFELEPLLRTFTISELPSLTTIEINLSKPENQNNQVSKPHPQLPPNVEEIETSEEYNLRESQLLQLLEKSHSPLTLLNILNSNPQEEKIKFVISKISTQPDSLSVSLISSLFYTLTEMPSLTIIYPTLNNWLKWLLIFQSSKISKLPNSDRILKSLRLEISTNLKQMPGLLSLQGRLDLLKSQLQLRELLATGETEHQEVHTKIVDADDAVKKADENIIYVNGENDEEDPDDVIASVGNSESEMSANEDETEEIQMHD